MATNSNTAGAAATTSNSNADLSLTAGAAPSLTSTDTGLPTLTTTSSDSSSSSSAKKTSSSLVLAPTGLPTISSNTDNPLGLPTLPGGYNYPAPTVPPTTGAPYLSPSNLPHDFVFIIVGGVIALFALLILAYRIYVAWAANRSTKRSAGRAGSSAANYHALGLGDYKHKMEESSHDLHAYPIRPSTGASGGIVPLNPSSRNSTLFFSPTAAAAGGLRNSSGYMNSMANPARGSTYLSSGYYGAGAPPGSAASGH